MTRETADILREIELLQRIQKETPPASMEWRFASRKLAPLFDEMAKRKGQ